MADALRWHLHQSGIPLIPHYLNNFIIVAPLDSNQCSDSLALLDHECRSLGVPIANHKRDGPITCLCYLGIEVDTVAGQLRLPANKLHWVQALLQQWGDRRACTRKELESLIGHLSHACKVVCSSCSILCCMLNLASALE